MSDLQDQVPDIIIGGDEFENPVDSVDIDDEKGQQQEMGTEDKPKKSVSFAGLGDGLTDAERAKKEFEEGGGLPEQPDNPDFTKLTPISPEIIGRQALSTLVLSVTSPTVRVPSCRQSDSRVSSKETLQFV